MPNGSGKKEMPLQETPASWKKHKTRPATRNNTKNKQNPRYYFALLSEQTGRILETQDKRKKDDTGGSQRKGERGGDPKAQKSRRSLRTQIHPKLFIETAKKPAPHVGEDEKGKKRKMDKLKTESEKETSPIRTKGGRKEASPGEVR